MGGMDAIFFSFLFFSFLFLSMSIDRFMHMCRGKCSLEEGKGRELVGSVGIC